MTPEELIKKHEEIEIEKEKIRCLEETETIKAYKETLRIIGLMEQDLRTDINTLGEQVTDWEPSALSQNKEINRSGRLELQRSTRTTRTIITSLFLNEYPLLAADIASIPVGKAEAVIGKDAMESVVEKTATYTYSMRVMKEATPNASKLRKDTKGKRERQPKLLLPSEIT